MVTAEPANRTASPHEFLPKIIETVYHPLSCSLPGLKSASVDFRQSTPAKTL